MSLVRMIAKRVAMGALAAWAILSIVFALFTLTEDWVLARETAQLRFFDSDEELIEAVQEEYFAATGLDESFLQNYAGWMIDMMTLDWHESFITGESALDRVVDAVLVTGTYVVPSILIAITLGVTLGVYVSLNPNGRLANVGTSATYFLFALPSFWVGGLIISGVITGDIPYNYSMLNFVLPVVFTTAALLGGYVSYARAHSLEYASTDFVKLVEAKGGSRLLLARHVARNSAIPFFSMLFTEALGLLVLTVFVIEVLFGIEGFGLILFESINERDLPVLMGGTVVIILVGVLGNVVQDVSYSVLDPRVDTGVR